MAKMEKKNKLKQKTGVEIEAIYNQMKKDGITPEKVMFYLLVHMEKMKAREIGMDLQDPSGKKCVLSVAINDGTCDERVEEPIKKSKYTLSSVV